jgi:hypothetical protein
MSVLSQITYGNLKYLQTIGIHRMFLNIATFSVTNRSIPSARKDDRLEM